jgi:hypothetical protein
VSVALFPKLKNLIREWDNWVPFITKFEKVWFFTSTAPITFILALLRTQIGILFHVHPYLHQFFIHRKTVSRWYETYAVGKWSYKWILVMDKNVGWVLHLNFLTVLCLRPALAGHRNARWSCQLRQFILWIRLFTLIINTTTFRNSRDSPFCFKSVFTNIGFRLCCRVH